MNLDGALSEHLLQQVADGLRDEEGHFRLDRSVLRKHYARLVVDEGDAISFLSRSAESWGEAGLGFEMNGSRLRLEMVYPGDSPILQRLIGNPSYRLSAIFPPDHILYDLAAGYNGLAFSEQTLELDLTLVENRLVVDWHFKPDAELESALRKGFL